MNGLVRLVAIFLALCTCIGSRISPIRSFSSRVRPRVDLTRLLVQSAVDVDVDVHTEPCTREPSAVGIEVDAEEITTSDEEKKTSLLRLQELHRTFVPLSLSAYPQCEVFLCGTVHVLEESAAMVREVIRAVRPSCVIVELCPDRVSSLYVPSAADTAAAAPLSLWSAFLSAYRERSLKKLAVNLLVWMQSTAAQVLGGQLGADLSTAALEAHRLSALLVLGDRDYSVTVQRVMDKLSLREKIKCVLTTIFDVLMLRVTSLWDKLLRRPRSRAHEEIENLDMEEFTRHFPALAEVVINERDEYLAQSVLSTCEYVCRYHAFNPPLSQNEQDFLRAAPRDENGKHRIVAVVGQGHLKGIQRHLLNGSIDGKRIREISSSSRHPCTCEGVRVVLVHTEKIFGAFPVPKKIE